MLRHIFLRRFIGFLGLALIPLPVLAMDIKPYTEISSFSHSEPIAIHALINDWDAPLKSGKRAFSFNRAEVGVALNHWTFGIFKRQDYIFEFQPETAKLIFDTKNKNDLTTGEEYSLDLDSNSFIARGLKLGYQKDYANFNIGLTVSYLEGQELTDGSISGDAVAVSESDYNFQFDVDYYYSEDSLFDRKIESLPKGQGYGIDFDVEGFINPDWHTHFAVRDLLARIYWSDTPKTVATGSSDNKEFDEDGYAIFKPVANGLESNEDFTQKIPTKVFLSSRYRVFQQNHFLFEYQNYRVKSLTSLGYGYVTDNNQNLDVLMNVTAKAMELRYRNDWFRLGVVSDSLAIKKAKTFGLDLALNVRF